ncbi:MAG: SRPBCC family protein [Solirubrobacterales bacterium]|nr:SRPBCC family protein [Solirubrobacterales bacterium]MBV8942317.1 SRPBCC family protein [Solirubrobacterales bacterium]MBV9168324.1 SRPBCC family protein [Solirubrobacterales bacterium]MBV9536899.1 SRPBCC family protein [Solirubrobacterales bacterium]
MSTWTTQAIVDGTPEDVLEVLSDPESCYRWSPIDFDLEDLDSERLETGSIARVAGRVAGLSVSFEIEVLEVGAGRLALTARGPMTLEVEYEAYPAADGGAEVWATVTVRASRSLTGRLAAASTETLLRAGALSMALRRIAAEVQRRVERVPA